jgi:glycerol dehydrogenase-like iron-containing ADH family enzyme
MTKKLVYADYEDVPVIVTPTMASNDPITAGICDRRNGIQGHFAQHQF